MQLYAVINMSDIRPELQVIIKRIKGYARHTKKNHRMYNKKIDKRKLAININNIIEDSVKMRSE